jgi:hypothetical protein
VRLHPLEAADEEEAQEELPPPMYKVRCRLLHCGALVHTGSSCAAFAARHVHACMWQLCLYCLIALMPVTAPSSLPLPSPAGQLGRQGGLLFYGAALQAAG